MDKLRFLTINLQTIIFELMNNNELMDMLQSEIPLLPKPFTNNTSDTSSIEIRIYYPLIEIDNTSIQDVIVYFDIICSKDLWIDNNSNVVPYEIARQIYNTLKKKSLFEVGVLHFKKIGHVVFNDSYDGLRISAKMMQI